MTIDTSLYNDLTALAHQHIVPEVEQALILDNALFKYFSEDPGASEKLSGGTYIQKAIQFGENNNVGFIPGDASALIPLNVNNQYLPATLNWKYFAAPLSITFQDMVVTHDTEDAIVNMMTEKVRDTKGTVARTMVAAMHGTSTSDVNSFNGLQDIFAASGTAYAGLIDTDVDTLHGYDDKGYSKWLCSIDSSTQVFTFAAFNSALMKIKGRSQQAGGATNYKKYLSFCNSELYAEFTNNEQIKQKFTPSKLLDAGFDATRIAGCDLVLDEYTPGSGSGTADNYCYILSVPSIKLFYKYGWKGKTSPLDASNLRVPNQPTLSNIEFFAGNLMCQNRRVNHVFTTLKPA